MSDGHVFVDEDEIAAWADDHPQPYNRDAYQGAYQDPTGTAFEPHVKFIRMLANDGLTAAQGSTKVSGSDGAQVKSAVTNRRAPVVRAADRAGKTE
jgi:hypothetical protein